MARCDGCGTAVERGVEQCRHCRHRTALRCGECLRPDCDADIESISLSYDGGHVEVACEAQPRCFVQCIDPAVWAEVYADHVPPNLDTPMTENETTTARSDA